jgi:hypothetical protein
VVAELTDHTGASEMYLMALVNSTVAGRRPAGHVELVDLSVEKKKAIERYKEQNGRSSAEVANRRPSCSPRSRRALADQPAADLCMEPLFPLFLESPSSDSSEADTAELRMHKTLPCSLQDTPSANVVAKTLKTAPSRQDQENPDKQVEPTMAEMVIDGSKTIKPSKARSTPKLGSLFSDGGISTRVQHHPLEMIAEQDLDGDSDSSPRTTNSNPPWTPKNSAERAPREKIDLSARALQHPLATIDESPVKKLSPVKERKPPIKKERKQGGAPSPQPATRKLVRDPKQQPQKRERGKVRETSRAPKLADVTDHEKPSLANPVMEKMPQIASPEPPYAWNKKLQSLPKLAVSTMDVTEPMMEERELRYSSPKMTESDAQDDLSFRVWERESKPKRKSISVSRDFQDSLDLEDSHTMPKHEQSIVLPQVTTFATPTVKLPESGDCEHEHEHEYPSPSSFTCGLSPTSLFSDDDNMFSRLQQGGAPVCKSPRSVLSDEIAHFASDSSSVQNDQLEFDGGSFTAFTYSHGKEMGESSSDEEFSELRYFQEAGRREPWLASRDGGVLDDTDLQFLLPPDFKDELPVVVTEISEVGTTRRHSRSSSFSKQRPPKRSVKFAPDLVREMTSSPRRSIRLPRPESSPGRDDDEQIYPSVKSWEVEPEEENASSTSTPRRRWHRSPSPKPDEPTPRDAGIPVMDQSRRRRWRREHVGGKVDDPTCSRRHRVSELISPCAGRLFSWPQRLAFKVSRSRRLDSDDDDGGTESSSFGRSARRDAQQVRRILKGSQKKFSNLTVADILDDSFAS